MKISPIVDTYARRECLPSLADAHLHRRQKMAHVTSLRKSTILRDLSPRQIYPRRTKGSLVCLAGVQHAPETPPAFAISLDERNLDIPAAGFDTIADALKAMARGELVVVLDDENRENEGDLIMAAEKATPETMAFMVRYTSGVICVGMTGQELDRLGIPLMVPSKENEESMYTAFTVTVDLRHGTTTGISASDRAATLKALADPSASPDDFKRPGHIFPLRYREGGVLRRPGHTEASVDLSRLAGCSPAGVLCEIVNDDGTMSRTPELLAFAKQHNLKCITIADLVRYRLKHEQLVVRTASEEIKTRYGPFTAYTYVCSLDDSEHIALVAGSINQNSEPTLACVHSESILGDVFGSIRCNDCQLDSSLQHIARNGSGVLVYLKGQEERGISLTEELVSYATADAEACEMPAELEDASFPVDLRDCAVAAHILRDLEVQNVQLLSNREAKARCLRAHGINVIERLPLVPLTSSDSKLGHSSRNQHRNGVEPHFV